jgi:hypothetical protein
MPELTHASFLLRLWRDHARAPWRAMVIDTAWPDEHQHFATLDALFAFLTTQTHPAPSACEQVSAPNEWEHGHYTPDNVS